MDVDVLVSGHTHMYVLIRSLYRRSVLLITGYDRSLGSRQQNTTANSSWTLVLLLAHGRAPSLSLWLICSNPHFSLLTISSVILRRDPSPSFALMDIQGTVVVTYLYQLHEGEVRVEKIEWRRDVAPPPPAVAPPNSSTAATTTPSAPSTPGYTFSGTSGFESATSPPTATSTLPSQPTSPGMSSTNVW